jgi:UDP-sulfoquinovose synthase
MPFFLLSSSSSSSSLLLTILRLLFISPGSVYHLTKTQEALHFQLYNRLHGIRITDLHQGVVWGTETPETSLDSRLVNRFDCDGDYGTILNRFLIQGALGYPLTVYGTGGQTRAFIHIKDCVQCLTLAMDNPPKKGERVHIYNQATQCLKVIDLANLVSRLSDSQIDFLPNPRKELPKMIWTLSIVLCWDWDWNLPC